MMNTTVTNRPIDVSVGSFRENGYAFIRAVFSKNEIEQLRKNAFASADHKGDLLSNPLLRSVVLDDRVLSIVRKVLGGTPVYFTDGGCVMGNKSHGYHKDNADREDPNAPDWQSDYTIIRLGLYLQDHSRHSGGLNIRKKSHNVTNTHEGENIYLRTRPGDLVLWNLRTSHSGNGRLLRLFPGIQLSPERADRLPQILFAPSEGERAALFWAYGLEDHHLKRYISYLKTRTYMVENWRNSHYDYSVWEAAAGKDLVIREMHAEIQGETGLGASAGYVPIPY
jgi:hypothetical protein